MHRRLSPHARLPISLILASLVAAAGCRGLQGPESSGSESDNPPSVGSGEVETVGQALAGEWTGVSIPATTPGSSSGSGTDFTVTGGGADIWTGADAFRFHYMTVTGNVTLTAEVTSQQNTNDFAKAGVMMREDLTAGARNVMTVLTPIAANGYRFQSRTTVDATTAKATSAVPQNTPGWVRIVRSGNNFTSFFSLNGTSWTPIGGTVTIAMPPMIQVGLAVTSHNTAALSTVQFANVTFNPPQTPPSPPPAPTGLTATPGNNQVALGWNPSSGANTYTVQRSTTQGSGHTNLQTGITATSFTDTTAANGTPYYYVVRAVNTAGTSGPSSEAGATPAPPPAPPASLTATPGNAQVMLSWSSVPGATSYTVKRSPNTTPRSFANVQTGIPGTSYTNSPLTNGITYVFVVTATGPGGEGGPSPEKTATPVGAPAWQTKDIGTVVLTGTYSESAGTHTVRGAGADMYNTADAFRFAYQTITGDVTITARVTGLALQSGGGTINTWAKAALMIRENDTPGARNVAVLISPTPTNQVRRQLRNTAGQSTTSIKSPTISTSIPEWLKLERVGNTFRAYHAESNTGPWTEVVPSASLTLTGPVLVGMAVTSHSTTQLVNGTFTNVTVTTPAPPSPPPAPTAFAAAGENNQAHLSWNPSTGATHYIVKQSPASNGTFTEVANVPAGSESDPVHHIRTGLANGTTVWFKVTANNAAGASAEVGPLSATPQLLRPSVRTVSPADGATNVPTTAGVALDLTLVNSGGGVDTATMNDTTVILTRASDGAVVQASRNTSGGADVVTMTPFTVLDPNTTYNFRVTSGLMDTTGAPFMPFSSSFTTGAAAPPGPTDVAFTRVQATGTTKRWTSITMGPENKKVYAATVEGEIFRWTVNTDGTLSSQQLINTIRDNNGGARAIIGLTFDPASADAAPILWVTHGGAALEVAPDWSGKLTRLTGASLTVYQDFVTNFPRSYKDHMTNSLAFKPGEPGVIYITQGSMNAMGAPDNSWGNRSEHLMSAAILRVNTNLITSPPLNIQTNDANPTTSGYNPFAANAPVTIYATGVRNAYDLVWHSNGELYTATNGSAASGNTPATPATLPSACTRRIDGATNGNYTGPQVPGITNNPKKEDDYLFRITQGGYYGHPNPSRCEWVLNGGNPTTGADNIETSSYPVNTQPDRNWRGPAVFNLTANRSPNGMIEWKAPSVPSLMGKLLVIRYSIGDDIVVLTIDPSTKGISDSQTGIVGFGGFGEEGPLDLTHNTANGDVYVTEYAEAGPTGHIWRLRPIRSIDRG